MLIEKIGDVADIGPVEIADVIVYPSAVVADLQNGIEDFRSAEPLDVVEPRRIEKQGVFVVRKGDKRPPHPRGADPLKKGRLGVCRTGRQDYNSEEQYRYADDLPHPVPS